MLKVRLLHAQHQDPEAVKLLTELSKREGVRLDGIAALLEEIGQYNAAELMYRKFVAGSKEPTAVLALAAYFGRRHRAKDALDLCDKARQSCPPETIGSACAMILSCVRLRRDAV